MPHPRPAHLLCLILIAASATGALALLPSAQAEVVRQNGFWADVAGYHGWFGSYAMGDVGTAWCVDHGLAAPDPDLGYRPAELADHPQHIRRAMAWALGAHGQRPDRATAAALTLVLHDLAHQAYPAGPLQIEGLTAGGLRGFEGSELQVLERARAIRADALAHADVQGPLRLTVQVDPVKAGRPGVLAARLVQPSGAGVAGVALSATLNGVPLPPGPETRTSARGEQRFSFTAAPGANRLEVRATVPDLVLRSFAPTAARAQRVASPSSDNQRLAAHHR